MIIKLPALSFDPTLIERATSIHEHACAHCPSAHFPPDEESLDYLRAPRRVQLESVFRCGWRPQKACRGYCDVLDVTEADLQAAFGPGPKGAHR